jgi:hypothetical protein
LSGIESQIRELRIQHDGRPYRVLMGGDKTGNERWQEEFVPKADRIFWAAFEGIGRLKKGNQMARNFQELQAKLPPEARKRSREWVERELKKMPLYKLRQAREPTQKTDGGDSSG